MFYFIKYFINNNLKKNYPIILIITTITTALSSYFLHKYLLNIIMIFHLKNINKLKSRLPKSPTIVLELF